MCAKGVQRTFIQRYLKSPETLINRVFHGFWQQKRAGTKPALVGRGDRT